MSQIFRFEDRDGDVLSAYRVAGVSEDSVHIVTASRGSVIPVSQLGALCRALAEAVPHCAYTGSQGDFWCIHPVKRAGDICEDHTKGEPVSDARELLNAYAVGHEAGAIGCRGFNRRDHAPKAFAALRAVLDLHHADEYGDCVECGVDTGENAIPYPCDTVKAITTALEAS